MQWLCLSFVVPGISSYAVPRPRDTAYEDFERNIRRPIQLRVSNFLKQWMEKQSSDFLDAPGKLSALGHQVDDFVRDVLSEDDPKVAKPLVGTLNKLVRHNRLRDSESSGGTVPLTRFWLNVLFPRNQLDGRLRGTEMAAAAGEPPLPKVMSLARCRPSECHGLTGVRTKFSRCRLRTG